jgi:protein-tyrosine phosphatase
MLSNVHVERIDQGTVKICWETEPSDLGVSIHVGQSPDSIDRASPAHTATGQTSIEISGLDPDLRHYFEIVPEGGPGYITAERRVPLERTINFRDLGGYENSEGLRVKWGQIFRSDNFSRLTDRDQTFLKGMGIKLVCDFRTPSEVQKTPDRLPDESIGYLHLPVIHGEFDFMTALERLKRGDDSQFSKDFMVKSYLQNIEEFPEIWGRVLECISKRANRPLIFHCTGGKDRAGTCAALLLLALGIPEETVVYDHQISNVFIAPMLGKVRERVESFGVDPEKVLLHFTAPRECIDSLLHHIRETYGSTDNYLRVRAKVSDDTLALLKQELLE